ncbi:MAG: urea carboxylase-associated family protein [Streptosporangiaceae bacterium]|nr:urea carboxylase-associated family protein [Streptosporangiaceae bacterium]
MATGTNAHETGTVLSARVDARARGGKVADAMPYLPANSTPFPPPGVAASTLTWAETVADGNYTHKVIARGTRVRLEDVTGEACAHIVIYNAVAPWERLNVADTVKIPWQAYLGTGHPLLSGDGRVLATIVADDSRSHDALCGTSTAKANQARYGDAAPEGPSPSGRELFILAAAKHGLTPRDLPPSISFFKGVRVEPDGGLTFTGSAGPGKSVELLAELPLIMLIANVPHPADPRPRYTCGPLRVHAWKSRPTTEGDKRWDATPEALRCYLNTAGYAAARGIA